MELALGLLQVLLIPVLGVVVGLGIAAVIVLWTRAARTAHSRRHVVG